MFQSSLKRPLSRLTVRQEFPLTQHVCSFQAFNWFERAHPRLGKWSAFLSLLIQTLILSKSDLTDIPRIMFNQMPGHPVALSRWYIALTIKGSKADFPGVGGLGDAIPKSFETLELQQERGLIFSPKHRDTVPRGGRIPDGRQFYENCQSCMTTEQQGGSPWPAQRRVRLAANRAVQIWGAPGAKAVTIFSREPPLSHIQKPLAPFSCTALALGSP